MTNNYLLTNTLIYPFFNKITLLSHYSTYLYHLPSSPVLTATYWSAIRNNLFGQQAPYKQTFIIRGIGYRANLIENDLVNTISKEFPYSRYLLVRAGHSAVAFHAIPDYIGIKTIKKDRKLTIYGPSKSQVFAFAQVIYNLRPPSVYTGRGIRYKKGVHRRKAGKKDVRKGRFF